MYLVYLSTWSTVLDPTLMSMRSKAEWFRAKNSAYRSVATSLSSNSLLVARAGNVELDRYPQLMLPGGRNPLICPTSIEHSASPYVVHG